MNWSKNSFFCVFPNFFSIFYFIIIEYTVKVSKMENWIKFLKIDKIQIKVFINIDQHYF
jgi:hypothetical protein